jgi:cytoskeletal protein RodZ
LSLFNRKKESGIHGLLLSWLVSYGVILLLAFLFILSAYFLLSRNLRDESFRVHEATVQQSQISMDYLLSENQHDHRRSKFDARGCEPWGIQW